MNYFNNNFFGSNYYVSNFWRPDADADALSNIYGCLYLGLYSNIYVKI